MWLLMAAGEAVRLESGANRTVSLLSPYRAKANSGPRPGTQTAESVQHFEISSFV